MSDIIQLPYNFTPRSYQLDFYKAFDSGKYNRFFLRWCRRSGKDKCCIALAAKYLMQRVGTCFYLFPSYNQGRKALFEGKDKAGFPFIGHIPEEIRKGVNLNEMKIEFKNGSILRVMGTDNIDSLVGTNPILLIFSEWAMQDHRAWDFLRPILDENEGVAIFNSTPRGQNHMYGMEVRNKGRKGWYFSEVQTLWPERDHYYPIMKPDQIENIKEEVQDDELVEQEYGVSYVAGEKGRYYAELVGLARKQGRIGNFPHDPNKFVDVIFDLGYSDDTAIIFTQRDGDRVTIIDYYENNTKEIAHYIRMLRETNYAIRNIVLPHDAEQGKFQIGLSHKEVIVKLLEDASINAHIVIAPKVHQKMDAIQCVRSVFYSYYFNEETTRDLVAKVGLYHRKWNKNRQMFDEGPAHDMNSHAADALSYEALTREDRQESFFTTPAMTMISDFNPLED